MYCEVAVKHKATITEAGLQAAVCGGQLGVAIPLAAAYARSAVYRLVPPLHSVGAFETVNRCFVIVREVNSRFSTYHVEGNSPAVSVPSLLGVVQDFASLLLPVLRAAAGGAAYRGISFTVQLFEDNARETGIAGKLTTLGSVVRERFAWSSLRSSVIAFLTSGMLIWQGLKQEPWRSGIYSLGLVIVVTALECLASGFLDRGKIKWKLKEA
jgi:hypothetical protein